VFAAAEQPVDQQQQQQQQHESETSYGDTAALAVLMS
jgi:hypothetical protein